MLLPYNRRAAVAYAHRWAYGRNPRFYNYEAIGGDCTSFLSQCVLAGGGLMNYQPDFGWYYVNGNEKSPSWSGVPYFYNFMTRGLPSRGPFGRACAMEELTPGDVIQLSFDGESYQHGLLVVFISRPASPDSILVATHSADWDFRPLSTYSYQKVRFLHMEGVWT